VVARQPGNADAWNNRGVALRELGRLDDAIASFSRALAINPGYAGALLNRGVVLGLDRMDYAAAIPDLERAAALNPALPWVHWFLVRMRRHVCDWRHFESEIALLDADITVFRSRPRRCGSAPPPMRAPIFRRSRPCGGHGIMTASGWGIFRVICVNTPPRI
jgi:tetratricopeptide (TPR) repeat protein